MSLQLSVVIPAYNEEKCVEAVLKDLARALENDKIDYEIIAIDNGATDSTGAILDRLSRENPRVKPLHFQPNQGFGGALLQGFAAAKGSVLAFTCADGEVPPESVPQLYRVLKGSGAAISKAKRMDRQDGAVRAFISLGYHLLVRVLFRLTIADMNGYPVLMTRDAYDKLKLSQPNWMINLEILSGARKLGLVTAELDVPHRPRAGGKSHVSWRTPIAFFFQVLRFRFACKRAEPSHS